MEDQVDGDHDHDHIVGFLVNESPDASAEKRKKSLSLNCYAMG